MNRTHGTRSRYRAGCRCQDCRDAAATAKRKYAARKRGDLPAIERTDAGPIADHLDVLVDSGWTYKAIARAVGLGQQTVGNIGRRRYPTVNVAALIILTVEPLEKFEDGIVDEVVVRRLVVEGADWREVRARRAERLEAARVLGPGHYDRLGFNHRVRLDA